MIQFTGERIVPEAGNCEPLFAEKMYQEHVARYAFASQWIQGKRVLDVGCGVGYGSRWMAQNGAASVRAFDLSPDAVGHAKEFYAHEKLTFEVASATNFDFDERFDVVTCFELIEHVDAQREVIQCIQRALKDDGVLIISTPRALEQKRTHFHTKEFSEQEFRSLLESSFPQVRFYFENNHFASLITDGVPQRIDQILPLKDQYSLAQADYFIAVASVSPSRPITEGIAPVLVIGDDKYVSLLERDIDILHNAEDRLVELVAARDATLAGNMQELEALRAEADALRSTEKELRTRSSALERELGGLREEAAGLRRALAAERELPTSVAELRREVALQCSDSDYLRDVVAAMQNSSSWKMTAPYRFVGGKLRQPLRMLRKASEYQRMHGTRALAGAIRRRLGQDGWSGVQSALVSGQGGSSDPAITNQHFDVVFAIGCWEGESKRYRVHNLAEGLEDLGYQVHVMPYGRIGVLQEQNVKADVVVLFRAPYDLGVGVDQFLKYAKIRGIKVVFDVDDLVFDPDVIDQIDGFRQLPESEQKQYIDGVHHYRELLLAADMVTVPTEYLRARVEKLGKTAVVIPNSINEAQQTVAAEILALPPVGRQVVRIGYFSGSRTHQADFAQCADALFDVMQENPNTVLRIVGYLDLDARWEALAGRIERMGFQPYKTMLRVLGECDINIAPLDLGSVFCHGKSELKFFEAGLLGIPTVASATDTFVRAIKNGVNGFALNSQQEWKDTLSQLAASAELRKTIGGKARDASMAHFSIQEVAKTARDAYKLASLEGPAQAAHQLEVAPLGAEALAPGRLRISWVIPGLIIGGGGHRNILRAAYFLSQFGHQVNLYFIGTEKDPQTIKRQIQEHFYPLDCPVHLFEGKIQPSDVVFATHWSTVNAALTARGVAKEIMYFVQDFEPAFAPMGTEYVLAENTYRLGLYHITSGPWCEVMLRRDFQAAADHFQFPVDRSIYYPRARTKGNRNLVFFAKPEMPRRCFELGVMALREFHRMRPDVEIVMFGSKHASKQSYDFPVTIREVLPTLNDLAQMYSDGDAGLVFSTTNPSLIPYEMMACGLPVIDLARGDNAVNYAGRTDIALLADPQPKRMAEEIAELIGNPTELASRREKGLALVDSFPSEEGMARRIESLIVARLESISDAQEEVAA
ncbi:methyltransferase domain-containing protein [Cupriavidus sp. BIC8F]|uniref:rhamnosyltransferase WsaF family glycosyltransferase n=1 Tax=Cupriavidus sp. BIC8F TaxID=3079014 RepID=UPI002916DCB6|nr:methyltransferase domain-containing protein [Cupriavidus sp. BIC8F]